MAPAPSEAPAFATKGDARNTDHNIVELEHIGSVEIGSRFEDSEGASRELIARIDANRAKRVGRRLEARKVNGAARDERVLKNQVRRNLVARRRVDHQATRAAVERGLDDVMLDGG